ncbi:nitroreductase family protein [Pseudonocardia spinosispora]|uniref:nitroreductase family protein n=1 Tax=Pseudonocardia spinosispora TaxID=103441 RepID=UPI00041E65E7|nr:nitroreductase family protein [Pseudonocardia spinosispora]
MSETLNLTPDELLTTTRSVRKRLDLDRPVPLELVKECVEIALQSPSASNRQHWHFVVVTDAEQRATIGDYYGRSFAEYAESKSAAGNLYADDPERAAVQERVGDSASYLAGVMGKVPVLVIPCIDSGSAELPAANQSGLWGSIVPAAWSYMLAARARGLGSAWTTLHQKFEREIGELLGIPETVHQAALLPTAYFTGETFRPAKRQPLDEVLHVNGW